MKITVSNHKLEEFELSAEQLGILEIDVIREVNKEYGSYAYYKPHDFTVSLITNDFDTYLKVRADDGVYIIHAIKYNIPLWRSLRFGKATTEYTTFTEIPVTDFDHDLLVHNIHSEYIPPLN
jgi:hypothetical protein